MKTFLCMGIVETAVFAWSSPVRGHSIDWLCFLIIFVLGKWAKQQEKRMWKPWAWSKEATKTMSGFSKLFFCPIGSFCFALGLEPSLIHCLLLLGTGEPAQGWAQQKWATRGADRSPQDEGRAARPGQWWAEDYSTEYKWILTVWFISNYSLLTDPLKVPKTVKKLWRCSNRNLPRSIRLMFCFLDSDWEWGAEGRSL